MMPGPKEVFFIFLIILLIFGAKRIPEIMRAMGRGLGEFRKARDDFEKALNEPNGGSDGSEDLKNGAQERQTAAETAGGEDEQPVGNDKPAAETEAPERAA